MRNTVCFQNDKGAYFGFGQTCKAASASSKAGLAASSFTSAIPFSTLISSTMAWALSFTFCTEAFTFSAACALCVTSANTYNKKIILPLNTAGKFTKLLN